MAHPTDVQLCAWIIGAILVPMTSTTTASSSRAPIANTSQSEAWNGPEGANWAEASPAGDHEDDADLIAPLLDAVELEAGDRVLDIGCGTGASTRIAARIVTAGHATGIDLSAAMLELARKAAAARGIGNIDFEVGDAQVHPFPAGSYDVAISHFGIMFFDDPVAAFTNIARGLRAGGRIAFVCPQAMERCDWYRAPLAAVLGREPTPATEPSKMFSLAEPDEVLAVLTRSGFGEIEMRPLPALLSFGPDAATAARFYVGSGPVRAILERHDGITEGDARTRLEAAMESFASVGGVRVPGLHWLVTARLAGTPSTGR